jgi:hypothetical protein
MDMTDNNTKPYKRVCPSCGKNIFHTNIKNRNRAEKIKKLCLSCGIKLNHADVSGKNNPFFGKHHTEKTKNIWKKSRDYSYMSGENHYSITKPGWKEKMSEAFSGKKNPMYGKTGALNPFYGKKHTIQTKLILKEKNGSINGGNYGKKFTEDHKLKIRMSHVKRLKSLGLYYKGNFSTKACKYFDQLNKQNNWNLQHAMNGGEIDVIGYWLDGYDKEKNVVVEYDESRHYDKFGNLKQNDVKRMNRIMNHLQCKFYRFNSITQTLNEYHLPTSPKNLFLASS